MDAGPERLGKRRRISCLGGGSSLPRARAELATTGRSGQPWSMRTHLNLAPNDAGLASGRAQDRVPKSGVG